MSGKRWIVTSVINNNVVSARNERNQERILIGKGIGFPKIPYELTDLNMR